MFSMKDLTTDLMVPLTVAYIDYILSLFCLGEYNMHFH
jgi:hypothetical protein